MKITFSSILDFNQWPQYFIKIRALAAWTASLTLLLALSACGVSLASDITPPPNLATQPEATIASGGNSQTAIVPAPASGAGTPTPVSGTPQPTPTITVFTGTVKGKLTLPAAATLPAGIKVTLLGFDTTTQAVNSSADVQPDGTYSFQGVEFAIGRAFIASVNYNGMDFDSSMVVVEAGKIELDLPISLETSSDTSVLVVDNMHVLFDFSIPNTIQVAQFFVISNPTTKTVAPAIAGATLLSFDLPQGATNLQFQDGAIGQRYIQTAKGFADTFSIPPDTQVAQPFQEVFAYELPYKASLNLTLPIPMDIANVSVLLPSNGTNLHSSQLQSAGPMNATGGATYNVYSAAALPKGSTLSMTISGQPDNVPATASGANNLRSILISAGVFLLVLVAGGLWLFRARVFVKAGPVAELVPASVSSSEDEDPDALIDEIAALDDLFKAGSLPEAAYQERRRDLKERLKSSFK
jgi:hypothetical protein